MDHWTEDMTARERVEAVALTLGRPRSVNWIREQAEVGSWETTRSRLDHLVEVGQLRTVEVDGDARYLPDPMRAYLDHIRELVGEHTREELRDELQAIADEIDGWKRKYDVDSLDELEQSLGDEGLPATAVRDRRAVVSHWEENRQYRRLITHALHLYDDLTAHARSMTGSAANHAD